MESHQNIHFLIFSFDRALQLEAALRSLFLHCENIERVQKITVLYKTSSSSHFNLYHTLIKEYSTKRQITFVHENDFCKDTISAIRGQVQQNGQRPAFFEFWDPTLFTVFLVDDSIFFRPFNLDLVCQVLRSDRAILNFSLRLGENINYSYIRQRKVKQPIFNQAGKYHTYNWRGKDAEFGYPMDISSSVYRSVDILYLLNTISFHSPNSLEGNLVGRMKKLIRILPLNKIACFPKSVAFSAPINRVQNEIKNKASTNARYTSEYLSKLFSAGYRVDLNMFKNFIPVSCHQEVDIAFTPLNGAEIHG